MFEAKAVDGVDAASGEGAYAGAVQTKKKPVLIILHQEHSTPGHIGQWFCRNGHALDIRKPRFGEPLPATLADHCGVVVFGGPQSANDPDEFIKREIDFVGVALKEARPFLGVCLGAQMLAKHLGARVDYHHSGHVEIGYHPVHPTAEGSALGRLVAPWPDRFFQWHREGFDLPCGGTMLVRSDTGPFPSQAFAYGPAAVGVQFHPEITYAQVLRWSGNNPMRLHMRGATPRIDQIHGHLMRGPQVHAWLDRFLCRWSKADLPLAACATSNVRPQLAS